MMTLDSIEKYEKDSENALKAKERMQLFIDNFNIEINFEYDYSTYPDGHEYDDPDWDSCDFLD